MNGIPEETANAQASAPPEKPVPAKRPRVAAHRAHVAPSKAKPGKKTTSAKKAAKAPKKATSARVESIREGTKTAKVLDLLKRPGGATLKDVMKATDWQPHSVRGFISGTLGKKMGLKIESSKSDDGERVYSIAK